MHLTGAAITLFLWFIFHSGGPKSLVKRLARAEGRRWANLISQCCSGLASASAG
jgi:hypothetical protein